MYIRMLRKAPCQVSYAGFSYRVEPITHKSATQSYITARLLTSTGRLWDPVDEHELTSLFEKPADAADAWSVGFKPLDKVFLLRALVNRMIDNGDAAEVEESVVVKRPDLTAEETAVPLESAAPAS